MTGRPTKLTPEMQEEIVGYIREGMYIQQACILAGITTHTYHNWINWGQEGTEPYESFFHAAMHAEVIAEREAMADSKSMQERGTDASGPRWFLERRFQTRWGKKIQQQIGITEVPANFIVTPPEENK